MARCEPTAELSGEADTVEESRYLFVSYSRRDAEVVWPVVEAIGEELALRGLPVRTWMDVNDLRPGEDWAQSITSALQRSVGLLIFVSAHSLHSDWISHEIEVATTTKSDRLILPIRLDDSTLLPLQLAARQAIDLRGPRSVSVRDAAVAVALSVEQHLQNASAAARWAVSDLEASQLAEDLVTGIREAEPDQPDAIARSVFVVHGHDSEARAELVDYLRRMEVEPVILSEQSPGEGHSLFQKFMSVAEKAQFAVVLLGADDRGASRKQYEAEGVGERALQFRARQNVVLELGFFFGRLGWEKVFVLYKEPDLVFPNFERPSDLDGVVFESISEAGWQSRLELRLRAARVLPATSRP
jgi:predicted nucleotide-binding protein